MSNLQFILSLVVSLMLVLAAMGACPPGGAGITAERAWQQVAVHADTLVVEGPIDSSLRADVLKTLSTRPNPFDTVLLASLGGSVDDAEAIGRAFARVGVRLIVVPEGRRCESACLQIAMLSAARFEPADGSRLMVHHEWDTYGSQRCWLCATLSRAANAFDDLAEGVGWHRRQQVWMNALAPGLGDRLATCVPNPFDSQGGVSFRGAAFKRFQAGDHNAIACPSPSADRATAPPAGIVSGITNR